MKILMKAFVFFMLALGSCKTKQETAKFTSMNEGSLVTTEPFFFSLPYRNTSDSAAVITITINEKKKNFMIDTGAPLSISKSLQKEFGFPLLLHTVNKDSNGDTTGVDIVRTTDIEIGPLQFKDVPALVLDLELPLFQCDSIDGLIGSNLLRLLTIQFNKPEQKIYFSNDIDSLKFDATTTSIPMQLDEVQSNPMINLHIDEQTNDTTLYDSGDRTLYTISKPHFDDLNKQGAHNQKIMATGFGISSQGIVAKPKDTMQTFLLKMDSLMIGKTAIKNVYAEPTPDVTSRSGRGLWDYGLVTMDYPKKQFYFTPYKNDMETPPFYQYGFNYQERDGKLMITVVWNKSNALNAGLKPGYEILEFGNFVPATISKCDWSAYCRKEAEASIITIKYKNEKGEIKSCSLAKALL